MNVKLIVWIILGTGPGAAIVFYFIPQGLRLRRWGKHLTEAKIRLRIARALHEAGALDACERVLDDYSAWDASFDSETGRYVSRSA